MKETKKMIRLSYRLVGTLLMAGGAFVPPIAQAEAPPNVEIAVQAAQAYHDTGAYQHDFDAIVQRAQQDVERERLHVKNPAIVLDIDETTLSNWPAMKANHLGYVSEGACDHLPKGPCGEDAWEERAEASAFAETQALIKQAQAHNVAVFFVTGRSEKFRRATEENLHKEGISGWKHLYMRAIGDHRPAAAYKTPLRAEIEQQGYTILANLGDQESDLNGGHALHRYRLPNPYYYIP